MSEVILTSPEELKALIRDGIEAALEGWRSPGETELLTTNELAERLRVSEDLVRVWVRELGCPHIAAGARKLRFRLSEVLAWLKERERE